MLSSLKTAAMLLAVSFILVACGGDSDSVDPPSNPTPTPTPDPDDDDQEQPQTQTGVFVDSPVAGVSYTTSPSGQEGVTNTAGEYDYEEGDTVQFSIGGINFPEVSAKGKVTPLDMGGEGANLTTPAVINVVRLLQTLDEDGDPENGITITEATSTALADTELDFTATTFESEANTAVTTHLSRELVSQEEAVDHFQNSLEGDLLGSWVYAEENGNINVLTFFADDRFVIAHTQEDGDDQTAGSAEYGYYSWDPVSGDFSVTGVIRETDGSGGLYNADEPGESEGLTLTIDEGILSLEFADGGVEFTQVASAVDNALVGAWRFREAQPDDAESSDILTFLNDTDYVLIHLWNSAAYAGDPVVDISSEWSTYEWAEDGTFTVAEPSLENDGPGGFYDANESYTMQVSVADNGELVLSETGEQEVETWARVGRYQVPLQDFEGDTNSASVQRTYNRFEAGVDTVFTLGVPGEGEEGSYDAEVAETPLVTLNADGSGSLDFDGEINTITSWTVSTSGVLTFSEYAGDPADAAVWTLTPIASKTGDAVLVQQSDLGLSYIGRARTVSE